MMETEKYKTWTLCPDKNGDWFYSDYHLGLHDYWEGKFNHPENIEYAKGWRLSWGMDDAYEARLPKLPDDSDYWEGYQDSAFERWCHLSCCWKNTPCDRFIKTTKCECTEGL